MKYKIILLVVLFSWCCTRAMAFAPDNACELPNEYTCVAGIKYFQPGEVATVIEACNIALPKRNAEIHNGILFRAPISVEASPGLPIGVQQCIGDRYLVSSGESLDPHAPFSTVSENYKCAEIPGGIVAGRIISPDGTVKCVWHKQYRAIQLQENTPSNCSSAQAPISAGNPIKLATGEKTQTEQIMFEGLAIGYGYESAGMSPAHWQQKPDEIRWGDKIAIRDRSSIYRSKAEACTAGLAEFKNRVSTFSDTAASWQSATAEYSCDTCLLKKNGKIISVLGIVEENNVSQKPFDVVQHLRADTGLFNYFRVCGSTQYQAFGSGNDQQLLKQNSQGDWQLDAANGTKTFDASGRLSATYNAAGQINNSYSYNTEGDLISVQNEQGQQFTYNFTNGLLNTIQSPSGKTLQFNYSANVLTKVIHPDQTTRIYHYEDTRFPSNLTGITDERGIRYATWKYDAQGRAISSEHAGGAEKTTLIFNADGSTTVTNVLGKKTTYSFSDILGVRRVYKVTGEPTANCVGANQAYTYTPQGLVETKTDWSGNITKYSYDNFGRELTRTDAFGAAEATSVQTCWHATLNQPVRIIEPTRITLLDYFSTGQLKSQTVKPRPLGTVDCATAL